MSMTHPAIKLNYGPEILGNYNHRGCNVAIENVKRETYILLSIRRLVFQREWLIQGYALIRY